MGSHSSAPCFLLYNANSTKVKPPKIDPVSQGIVHRNWQGNDWQGNGITLPEIPLPHIPLPFLGPQVNAASYPTPKASFIPAQGERSDALGSCSHSISQAIGLPHSIQGKGRTPGLDGAKAYAPCICVRLCDCRNITLMRQSDGLRPTALFVGIDGW
jgi:hypothetical protein